MKSPFFKTSHDSKNKNKCDSNSSKQENEGVKDFSSKNCENASILLHTCTNKNSKSDLHENSIYDPNKMKLSNTSSTSVDTVLMSSISKQITETIDKPADIIIDKKPQCKSLSKSDSGFSEKNLSTVNGKEASENIMTSINLSSDAEVPSEECEEEDYDSNDENNEVKKTKEMSVDQAHKLFDRRYGAEMVLSSISRDLKNEFEEAGASSPLERSIKKLRRLNSVNIKENQKSTFVRRKNPVDISDDDYEDESYSDDDGELSQGR